MLELQNVEFCVADKTILENINLKFDYGKIYAITGHNGSGKSTLVKVVMGILKQTHGKIVLDGKNIDDLDIPSRSKAGIGFTFQQPIKFKGLTVRDLIETAAHDKLNIKCGCEYLSRVGLCAKDYYDRELSSSLSGGELKRIELAICLAENKKINIFDEPEAGIDIWSFGGLADIFNDMRKRGAMTIIVTHQQKILDIADEIIVLDKGRVKKCGKAKDILPTLKGDTCKKLDGEAKNEQN